MIFIDQFFFFKENRENEIKLLQKIINTQLEVTPKEAETQLADTNSPTTPQRTPSVEGATVVVVAVQVGAVAPRHQAPRYTDAQLPG